MKGHLNIFVLAIHYYYTIQLAVAGMYQAINYCLKTGNVSGSLHGQLALAPLTLLFSLPKP